VLDLTYYGGAADVDKAGSLRLVRSLDQGRSFGASTPLAAASFEASRQWPLWMGDYMGIGIRRGTVVVAYVDGSSGNAHVSVVATPL